MNFIDTADAYSGGKSEEIVGRAVKADRDRWVIATKVGYPVDSTLPGDLSRKYVMRAVDQSLRRLGTDYIDLYYLHRDDATTPLEETVRALADLVHQGRIRYVGVSNFRAWRLADVVRLCKEFGIDAPAACQPQYNWGSTRIELRKRCPPQLQESAASSSLRKAISPSDRMQDAPYGCLPSYCDFLVR